ncbi:MAG TPA: ORF6N domain-containing protein [Steroidobacteraceae bacterium]|nr:ORF6N domain-containing protein [Steroidobacteraceae bacterium]
MASSRNSVLGPVENIARSIWILRGRKILLDAELAGLYGVTTRRLNEQVRRNRKRFPDDFLFELALEEFANLKSHFATSSWGGRRKLPWAFTEHGAIMAATVLNSARAAEMTVYIVRAFVKLRTLLASNKDLADKLAALERSVAALDLKTQEQFKEVYEAIRGLMSDPPPRQRPIGFTADLKQEIE